MRAPCSSGSTRVADLGPLFAPRAQDGFNSGISPGLPPLSQVTEADSKAVLAVLVRHQGKGNAITSRELSQKLGISTREVRQIIASLVETGSLIGASVAGTAGGFYWIMSIGELEETRAILRSRASEIFRRDAALRRTWERLHGQALQPLLIPEKRE